MTRIYARTCIHCGRVWQVSALAKPTAVYICPDCEHTLPFGSHRNRKPKPLPEKEKTTKINAEDGKINLGEIVHEYRLNHNLSQRKFAKLCGLSNGYISMLEKNCNPSTNLPIVPTVRALKNIATVMGINWIDLYLEMYDEKEKTTC